MSLYDYRCSQRLLDVPSTANAMIMAAMQKADPDTLRKLVAQFPLLWEELCRRSESNNGRLPGDGAEGSSW